MNTAAVVAGATALGIASCCWGSSAGPTCTAQVAAARRCEPEPEPEVLLSQPKSRRKPEPKQAGQYFDNDFPYSSVVEEGAAAVRQHGEFLPDTRCEELEAQAATRWDEFYRRHAAGFFKPRNYLLHCFPELAAGDGPTAQLNGVATSGSDSCPRTVLEVGCGAGDTAFTLLELNPTLNVLACDFSPAAVATTKASQLYAKHSASGRCKAFVWDLTHEHLPQEIAHLEGQLDVVVAVFVLSAIAPDKHADVADRLVRLLRPGSGVALFRDYGRYVSVRWSADSPLFACLRSLSKHYAYLLSKVPRFNMCTSKFLILMAAGFGCVLNVIVVCRSTRSHLTYARTTTF